MGKLSALWKSLKNKKHEQEREAEEIERKQQAILKGKMKLEENLEDEEEKLKNKAVVSKHHTLEATQVKGLMIIGFSPEEQDQILKIYHIFDDTWRVIRTKSWPEAQQMIESDLEICMVVFDCDMLGITTVELIENCLVDLSARHIHVIMVGSDTSEGGSSLHQRCMDLGATFLPREELSKLDGGQSHAVTIDDGIGSTKGGPSGEKDIKTHQNQKKDIKSHQKQKKDIKSHQKLKKDIKTRQEELGAKIFNVGGILAGLSTTFFVFEGLIFNSIITSSVECEQRWLPFTLCVLGGFILLSTLLVLALNFRKWLEEMDYINLSLEKITEDKMMNNKMLRDYAFWILIFVFLLIASFNGVASWLHACPRYSIRIN